MTDDAPRLAQEEAAAAVEAARRAQQVAEAALKRAQDAVDTAAVNAAAAAVAASPTPAAKLGPLTPEAVDTIRAGYTFEGAALEMGALVNGDAQPAVQVRIPLAMTNRHGLVGGATGTGKTKTLQVLAEQLAAAGVPVFAADIKGDLSGIASAGESNEKLLARTQGIGQDWQSTATPTEFFSLGGIGRGIPQPPTAAES
ncbi:MULTISPECIES: helicase HerA-like domain-containing protein [Subtercola]|uniref:helicase HerA-like domain-containing protein n=1 Tax=Subtercola TaxID=120212 RepID=UPI0026C55C4E